MGRLFAVLKRIGAGACLLLLAACNLPVTPAASQVVLQATAAVPNTPTPAPLLTAPTSFQEAPVSRLDVDKGLLPPLEQRLPKQPMVVMPVERVGEYGGAWRMAITYAGEDGLFLRTVAYEPLVRWTTEWSGIEPNLVESYSSNRNATEFTFTLRKGLRWSDGADFTTDDIRFWYEDVLLNSELTPVAPHWLKARGQLASFEFVDDLTFRVRFPTPNSLFLQWLATPDGMIVASVPRHYASKFHRRYVGEKELAELVQSGRYQSWVDMFARRVGINSADHANFTDPARPRLSAWILATPYTPDAAEVIWVRNPYYWKVDPQGNQLPYLDRVVFTSIRSRDDLLTLVLDGKVDMQNLPLFSEQTLSLLGERSDLYRFIDLKESSNNAMVVNLNLSHEDVSMRELFQNRNFRIGLSYATNRKEIIDTVLGGKVKPWQPAPREDSPFYDALLAAQYIEYDLESARSYLDRAGFGLDVLGRRLGPDGKPISFVVLVPENEPEFLAMVNILARQWSEVGVEVSAKVEPLPVFLAAVRSNLHDAAAWHGGASSYYDVLMDPGGYAPVYRNVPWAMRWTDRYTAQGNQNNPLNDSTSTMMGMYARVWGATSTAEQFRLMKHMMTLYRDSYWTIGIAQSPDRYGIVKRNFKNVPDQMPSAWLYPDPGPANPEQFYLVLEGE